MEKILCLLSLISIFQFIKSQKEETIYTLTNMIELAKKLKNSPIDSTSFILPQKDKEMLSISTTNVFEDYKNKLQDRYYQELEIRSKSNQKIIEDKPLNYEKDGITISRAIGIKIFELLNNYRKENKLNELSWNEDVYRLTLNQSYYMEEQKQISHYNLINRIGGRYPFANENVAMFGGMLLKEDDIVRKFFDMWRKSDGHDKNMKEVRVNQGSVAIVINLDTKEYYSTMILIENK